MCLKHDDAKTVIELRTGIELRAIVDNEWGTVCRVKLPLPLQESPRSLQSASTGDKTSGV